ncbi:hypothetical protein ACQW02_21170 [Humitalea sp. 24SJ18S-53]|uniref:hypothetical protein n=1 Tax=Humitalea sp. 24SJ18S-53 TaxID=3422307 RepID=UPI003D676362
MTGPFVTRRAGLLALPLLAGCSVLDRPYVETLRYPLQPARPAAMPVAMPASAVRGGRPRRPTLMIRGLRAAPGLDARGLRVIRADGTERLDPYAEWVGPPNELVEEQLRRWLAASGLFGGIVAQGTRARTDLVLEGEVTALEADLRDGQSRAGIAVLLLAGDDGGGGRVVGQWAVIGRAPLPASTNPDGPPPGAIAASGTEALAGALTALEDALRAHA